MRIFSLSFTLSFPPKHRVAVSRKQYVYNPYPNFIPPLGFNNRPSFIRHAMQCASNTDVARNEVHYAVRPRNPVTGQLISRRRRLNEHRARALRAMVQAMLYYFNIASRLVMVSVEKLSDDCGLSTISKAGNKSITRASRLITHFMEPMGLVTCQKVWDKIMGAYLPKLISLTPLFFMLFNISHVKLDHVRRQQMNWLNSQLLKAGKKKITLLQAECRAKEQYIHGAFHARKSKHLLQKQKRKALKIIQLEESNARSYILNSLIKRYSAQELSDMGVQELKKKVSIEYFRLRNLAESLIPPD